MAEQPKADFEGNLPDLQGLLDPQVELKLHIAFRRVYEYFYIKTKDLEKKVAAQQLTPAQLKQEISLLVGDLAIPLINGVLDPVLASLTSGVIPHKNTHLTGGSDKFVAGDIIDAAPTRIKITTTILGIGAVADGEFLKRSGANIIGASGTSAPASQLDSDGTILDVNVITDGEYLKRVGATVVSGVPGAGSSITILNWLAL